MLPWKFKKKRHYLGGLYGIVDLAYSSQVTRPPLWVSGFCLLSIAPLWEASPSGELLRPVLQLQDGLEITGKLPIVVLHLYGRISLVGT